MSPKKDKMKSVPNNIVEKLLKTKNKQKILKATREEYGLLTKK